MASTIKAYQLFYSRVEKSAFAGIPHVDIRNSGFQVVYHAPEIAEDVAEIERRVKCFQPKRVDDLMPRFQFFTTESGRVVVTHSRLIEAHPEITDPNRRDGAFIAHALVFDVRTFRERTVNSNPFAIIEGSLAQGGPIFVADAEEMRDVVRDNQRTVEIRAGSVAPRTNNRWKQRGDMLYRLVKLGRANMGDQTIAFIGEDERDVEALLENLIGLTPPPQRLNLSFDTLADGCQPVPGSYFVIGANRRISNAKFINVDLANPQINVNVSDPKETGYSNWLRQSLEAESLETTRAHAAEVQSIDAAFSAGRLVEGELDPVAVEGFLHVNEELILQRFREAIGSRLTASLADALDRNVRANTTRYLRHQDIVNVASHQDILRAASVLAPELYDLIVQQQWQHFKQQDLDTLTKLAEESRYLPLLLVPKLVARQRWTIRTMMQSLLGQSDEEKDRIAIIDALVDSTNDDLLTIMHQVGPMKWGDAKLFATTKSEPILVKFIIQSDRLTDKEQVELIVTILKQGGGKHLDALVPLVEQLPEQQIRQLQQALDKYEDVVAPALHQLIWDRSEATQKDQSKAADA